MDLKEKEVSETLNEIKDYKYYVYALCEKKGDSLIPFYIGKGEGGRVWAHEKGEESELEYLRKNFSGEELENEISQLSDKYKKIKNLGNENIEKIIIKSGMTSMEAFMAEGALINFFQRDGLSFSSKDHTLTNIQKGHSSEGEKKQGFISKARTIDEFYEECAKPPLIIDNLKEKVMIRCINNAYPQCEKLCKGNKEELNKAIKESVKGFWREANPECMDYVFAVNQGRVKGVYKIIPKNGKKTASIWDINNEDYPYYPGLEIREKDYELCKKLKDYCENNHIDAMKDKAKTYSLLSPEVQKFCIDFFNDPSNKNPDYSISLKNWLQRKYIFIEDIPEDDKNYEEFIDFIGRKVVQYKRDKDNYILSDENGDLIEPAFKERLTYIYSEKISCKGNKRKN